MLKDCVDFLQRKQLPEFKRNCPACGSKTKAVLGPNPVGIASIVVVLLVVIVGGVYWQVHRAKLVATITVEELLKTLQARLEQKDYAEVVKVGQEALKRRPQDADLLNNVGSAAMKVADYANARVYLQQAVDLK